MLLTWGTEWRFEDLGRVSASCTYCGAAGVHLAHGTKRLKIQGLAMADRDEAFALRCRACSKDWRIEDSAARVLRADLAGAGGLAVDFTPVGELKGHAKAVRSLCFSTDGELLASRSDDGAIKVWRAADGQLIGTLAGAKPPVLGVSFNSDSNLLASGSELWDARTGARTAAVPGPVLFGPDATLLTTWGGVGLWDRGADRPRWHLEVKAGSAAFSRGGRVLALGTGDGVELRETATGAMIRTVPGKAPSSLALSADGTLLAGAADKFRVWDTATGHERFTLDKDAVCMAVAFSPDGAMLGCGGAESARLWSTKTGERLRVLTAGLGNVSGWYSVQSLAFSPDGRLLAAGHDKTVQVWRRSTS